MISLPSTRTRRPRSELPADLQPHRCIGKEEVAALMGLSPKTVDQGVYGDAKRGIAPWGPPSFLIGRRRVWRLKDVLRWLDRQAKGEGR
jgi:predicted DNA-binding transcriptional regulator AlpA